MKENDVEELPPELSAVRDAAVANAYGESPAPKSLDDLFEWLYWNSSSTEFDSSYYSMGSLDLTDADARDELELAVDDPVSDEQRLEYARRQVNRTLKNDNWGFAHAYKIESSGGKSTYLCGTSWPAGQGGPDLSCDGTFPSEAAYLAWLEDGGMSNLDAEAISMELILKHWQR